LFGRKLIIPVFKKEEVLNKDLYSLFMKLSQGNEKASKSAKQIYAINNSGLRIAFETFRDNIQRKHQDTPTLFKKDDWKSFSDLPLRKSYIQFLGKRISNFRQLLDNNGSKVNF